MNKMSLGDRIKANYESRQQYQLTRRTPVIVRLDGRAFHTYTRTFNRPFDQTLIDAMVASVYEVGREMQGFKLGYVQSDEVSFLITDYDTIETEAWFDYNKSKIESVTASIMTAYFNKYISTSGYIVPQLAFFDARAFNIPENEVTNYFVWRAKDWERNSLTMYASAFFCHKQLHEKNREDKHGMLHSIGKNWTKDLSPQLRNGTWMFSGGRPVNCSILPNYESISSVVNDCLKAQE